MKNILIVTTGNIARGGVQKFLIDWIKTSRIVGEYSYTWYCCGKILDEDLKEEFEELDVRILTGNLKKNMVSKYWKYMIDLKQILKDDKYDIIHMNSGALSYSFLGVKEATRAGVARKIVHSHGSSTKQQNYIGEKICSILRKYVVKHATVCAACSEKAAQWMFGNEKVKTNLWNYIKNTIDVSAYKFNRNIRSEYRKKLRIKEECLLGNIGRMLPVKNQFFLLEIMKDLKENGYNIKLLIIGTGPLHDELYSRIAEYHLENLVILAGEKKNVSDWLQAMDILIMPSLHEGLPISAIEAQASGLPCLFADNFSREIKIGNNVAFLPLENINVWTENIKKLCKVKVEREKGAEKVTAKGFDIKTLENVVIKLYGQ